MSRKRFIKLLMSKGESLHSARAIAFLYNSSKKPYKKAYQEYLLRHSTQKAFESFSRSMRSFGDSIAVVSENFYKFICTLHEGGAI